MKLRAAHKSQMCFFTNMEILLFDQLELCPVFTLPVDVSKTGKKLRERISQMQQLHVHDNTDRNYVCTITQIDTTYV
jgi:hypothetical protein